MTVFHSKSSSITIAFIFFLLLLEIGARTIFPIGPMVPHPILNHVYLPNQHFAQMGVQCQTNSEGWIRKDDVLKDKPKDVFRVFYIGDSFVASACDDAIPAYIETALRDKFAAKKEKIEVINAGIASHSPALYYLNLKNYIIPMNPDLVVLNIDMTDVYDDYLCGLMGIRDEHNELIAVPMGTRLKEEFVRTKQGLVAKSRWRRALEKLGEFSRFLNRVIYLYDDFKESSASDFNKETKATPDGIGPFDWCHEPWSKNTERLVKDSMSNVGRIVKMLQDEKVRIMITGVPHLGHFTGEYSLRPFDTLKHLSDENGIYYLDSFLAVRRFLDEKDPATIYFPNDMHLNIEGNKLWARAHLEALLDPRNKLLPDEILKN